MLLAAKVCLALMEHWCKYHLLPSKKDSVSDFIKQCDVESLQCQADSTSFHCYFPCCLWLLLLFCTPWHYYLFTFALVTICLLRSYMMLYASRAHHEYLVQLQRAHCLLPFVLTDTYCTLLNVDTSNNFLLRHLRYCHCLVPSCTNLFTGQHDLRPNQRSNKNQRQLAVIRAHWQLRCRAW